MAEQAPSVRRGEIVIVALDPTKGHELRNTRPCVIVQNDVGNRHSDTTGVAPVKTTHRRYPFEVLVTALTRVTLRRTRQSVSIRFGR